MGYLWHIRSQRSTTATTMSRTRTCPYKVCSFKVQLTLSLQVKFSFSPNSPHRQPELVSNDTRLVSSPIDDSEHTSNNARFILPLLSPSTAVDRCHERLVSSHIISPPFCLPHLTSCQPAFCVCLPCCPPLVWPPTSHFACRTDTSNDVCRRLWSC